jgi:hypothetical protein
LKEVEGVNGTDIVTPQHEVRSDCLPLDEDFLVFSLDDFPWDGADFEWRTFNDDDWFFELLTVLCFSALPPDRYFAYFSTDMTFLRTAASVPPQAFSTLSKRTEHRSHTFTHQFSVVNANKNITATHKVNKF